MSLTVTPQGVWNDRDETPVAGLESAPRLCSQYLVTSSRRVLGAAGLDPGLSVVVGDLPC